MRFYVGVTDYDWFRFLAGRPDIDEVNFWQPSGEFEFKALQPAELFLFHSFLACFRSLAVSLPVSISTGILMSQG